jgi:hypothetical protein
VNPWPPGADARRARSRRLKNSLGNSLRASVKNTERNTGASSLKNSDGAMLRNSVETACGRRRRRSDRGRAQELHDYCVPPVRRVGAAPASVMGLDPRKRIRAPCAKRTQSERTPERRPGLTRDDDPLSWNLLPTIPGRPRGKSVRIVGPACGFADWRELVERLENTDRAGNLAMVEAP